MIQKDEKQWYALYVRSRSEKKVYQSLLDLGIESFLPLITRTKQWSDRRKKVDEPLFRSYVFVHSLPTDYYTILNVFGVMTFVTFERKPVPVPENQIVAIKKYIDSFDEDECSEQFEFEEGQMVRIKSGQMAGLTGKLGAIKNKKRFLVYIDVVNQYLPIDIARARVEPINEEQKI